MDVAIVGLGLIGGSFAKSIKERTDHAVYGIDTDPQTMSLVRLQSAITDQLTDERLGSCDFVLLALRPHAAVAWLSEHAYLLSKHAIVVDMCGVKRQVVEPLSRIAHEQGFTYVGGHPMAGKERGGFAHSSAQLFVGAHMILTPDVGVDMKTLECLKSFFTDVGFADLTFSDPDEHDKIIAYTSQLAHVVSSAYVKSPESMYRRGFSAGSFQDMTRVARLDEDMWTELFLANADYLETELDLFIQNLKDYQTALRNRDEENIRSLLREGRVLKSEVGGC